MRVVDDQFLLAATDLSNHLGCSHLTSLNRLVALNEIKAPGWRDPSLDVLIKRGQDHEAAYVEFLVKKGLKVINLKNQSMSATIDAMKSGADVIVQARVEHKQWMGYADILLKVAGTSKFGNWQYEVQDTKLSQNTKAATILQLCLYTEIISILQEAPPEKMYVVKPGQDFPTETYRFAEFQSYYKLVKRNFEEEMEDPKPTYPDPVEQCNICSWWQSCDKRRHDDDHLSLVAGLRSSHIDELIKQEIHTLATLAQTTELRKPERGHLDSLKRKQQQARIQFDGRNTGGLLHKMIPIEPGRGLNRLPDPDKGDIYFDIEGDPFFENGGLEYLLGYAVEKFNDVEYEKLWATNRVEEKKSFSAFMKFVTDRWKKFPKMHIYHFAPYEPSALKRLARVHALYEKEVDDLLRAERFIDLHTVFKESFIASVETYSLKELEKFTPYLREMALHDASVARKVVELALELNDFASAPKKSIEHVEIYNEDDCLATKALHEWLEAKRKSFIENGHQFQRPELKTGEATENVQINDTRAQALFNSLTFGLPEDRTLWTEEQHAKWLLAHQIEYFRREDKSAWWEFFRVHELEHEDLLDERKAITGLTFVGVLPKIGGERNTTHRYSFPPQDVAIDEGDKVIEVKGEDVGTVRAISLEHNTIDIKKSAKALNIHPNAVHVSERVDPGSLATSLMDIAATIDDVGLSHGWPYHAAKDLLMKRPPKLSGGSRGASLLPGEDLVAGAVRIALHLDRSVLAIQGPPGAGKTFTGATMIAELVRAGKKVGITAVSHKVIRNLAEATIERSDALQVKVSFVHKVKEKSESLPDEIIETDKSDQVRAALNENKVGCGTAWLWAEDNSREVLDYLFVDEAGQMSLSQVLAASRAAKNLILLGDPQQLEQPQRGAHPEGSDVAGLTYLLNGHPTMPDEKGLFLGETRRLHPKLCKLTSTLFYEGRLTSFATLERQVISGKTKFSGAGFFYVPVKHHGNQSRSLEEVHVIDEIVNELLRSAQWTNKEGVTRTLTTDDILIIAPYNAQVGALKEKLPGMRVGTVDKFQGQEAPVVIYSMTASTIEDAPKGMSFLFNPNRLNVATSRAKSVCILVASPKLFEADCRTIDQMRWANTICYLKEVATVVS